MKLLAYNDYLIGYMYNNFRNIELMGVMLEGAHKMVVFSQN